MVIQALVLFMLLFLGANPSPAWASGDVYPAVLATDTNHDGTLNTRTLANGEDKFLVKPNPIQLKPTDQVFQTNKDGIYTSATLEDLMNSRALKQLLMAKITSDGNIKLYTLPNLGYSGVVWVQNANGSKDVYLTTPKARFDKVERIKLKAPLLRITSPEAKDTGPT